MSTPAADLSESGSLNALKRRIDSDIKSRSALTAPLRPNSKAAAASSSPVTTNASQKIEASVARSEGEKVILTLVIDGKTLTFEAARHVAAGMIKGLAGALGE